MKRFTPLRRLCIGALLCAMPAVGLATSLETFLAREDHSQVRLSPDGKKIGIIRQEDNRRKLLIVDAANRKVINQIYFSKQDSVGSYQWISDNRLIIHLSTRRVNREADHTAGELYAIDADAKEGKFIFGIRSMVGRHAKVKQGTNLEEFNRNRSNGYIIHRLDNDPEHILVLAKHWVWNQRFVRDRHRYGTVYRVNIFSGKTKQVAKVTTDRARIFYDEPSGEMYAWAQLEDKSMRLERYDFKEKDWQQLNAGALTEQVAILAKGDNPHQLVMKDHCGNPTLSLCLYDSKTGEMTTLKSNPHGDMDYAMVDKQGKVFALSATADRQRLMLVNDKSPRAQQLVDFANAFAGKEINVRWPKRNDDLAMIRVDSDIQPSVWYLFDAKANKMHFVANSRKGLDAKQLHPKYPFAFKGQDDLQINGYLTMPKDKVGSKPASVVLVHGGPIGVRDHWHFDGEVQALANNGYAVIQINYRGSGGYGREFLTAGFGNTGTKIQQDIKDGVDFLSAQGFIDDKRVCIMGGSFGGYSAVQSSLLFPQAYRCAIANAGVYDYDALIDQRNAKKREKNALTEWMGDEDTRFKHSPLNNLKALKTPLLLTHGEKDFVAPIEQAYNLKKQLEANNKHFEWLELDNEGHYYYKLENRVLFFKTVLAFLQKHNPS